MDNSSGFAALLRSITTGVVVIAVVAALGILFYAWGHKLRDDIDAGKVVLIDQNNGQVIVSARPLITPALTEAEQKPTEQAGESPHTTAVDKTTGDDVDTTRDAQAHDKSPKAQGAILQDDYCSKPSVAILVANIGLSKEAAEAALQLPKIVSLGIMPYSSDVGELANNATSKGFEVLINLPMQPSNYPMNDPGPYALLSNLSIAENVQRMESVLNKSNQILGAYSSEDETFTNTASNIAPIMAELKKRNLIFVYSGGVNDDALRKANKEIAGKTMIVNIRLDEDVDANKIKENFKKLEGIARAHGYAVGIMHAYPLTIQLFNQWLADNDKSDVTLVPLSKLLKVQEDAEQKEPASAKEAEKTVPAPAAESGK